MTGLVPISAIVSRIVARVLDKRQREESNLQKVQITQRAERAAADAKVAEDPESERVAEYFREPQE